MDSDFWTSFGYGNIPLGDDGFPVPGELIKFYRIKQGLTQEDLAYLLGCSRAMVGKMETRNYGLNDIVTRRKLVQVLGISPFALGLAGAEIDKHVLYDSRLLHKTFELHREAYFTGSHSSLAEIDEMIGLVRGVSTSIDNRDHGVLEVLCEYYILGLDAAREEMDLKAADRYAKNALAIAEVLDNPLLQASTLLRYVAALVDMNQVERAKPISLRAMSLVDDLPATLVFGVFTHAYLTESPTEAKKMLKKAINMARTGIWDDDPGFIRPSIGFARRRLAQVMIASGENMEALAIIDTIKEDQKYKRRHSIILAVQAEALFNTKDFDESVEAAQSSLLLAQEIKSKQRIADSQKLCAKFLDSPVKDSLEVRKLRTLLL